MRGFHLHEDCTQHRINISQHVIIPEAQHSIPATTQLGFPQSVGGSIHGVLAAIEFNHQALRRAGKVNHVPAHWVLAPELVPDQPTVTQSMPETALGISSSLT